MQHYVASENLGLTHKQPTLTQNLSLTIKCNRARESALHPTLVILSQLFCPAGLDNCCRIGTSIEGLQGQDSTQF